MEQLDRIRHKLDLARRADAKCEVFGADGHKYRVAAPVSGVAIERFEAEQAISLPACYKAFLTHIGNGGAGPNYGVYALGEKLDEYTRSGVSRLAYPCVLSREMTQDEWRGLVSGKSQRGDAAGGYTDPEFSGFGGILPIGSQGCTYGQGLILNGEFQGHVVNVDFSTYDMPHICYDNTFLAWYERWLDEILSGILLQKHPEAFGHRMGGDDSKLLHEFDSGEDYATRLDALCSMSRLLTASAASTDRLRELCNSEDPKIRHLALNALVKLDYEKSKDCLTAHLHGGDDDMMRAAQSLIQHARERGRDWQALLQERLSAIQHNRNTLGFFCVLLEEQDLDFGASLLPLCSHENVELRASAVYSLGSSKNKSRYIEAFVEALRDPSSEVVESALDALEDIEDSRLLEPLYEVAKRFKPGLGGVWISLGNYLAELGFRSTKHFIALYQSHGDGALEEVARKKSWLSNLKSCLSKILS